MKFTKMHGCGNNYIYVNLFEEIIDNPNEMSIRVADKNFGIGSDGLITIGPSDKADCMMRIYNADGSEGKMCGNGIRCVAKYVFDHGMTNGRKTFDVDTLSGVKTITVHTGEDGKVESAVVDMGKAELSPSKIPCTFDGPRMINEPCQINGKTWNMTAVSMGNPHAVTFVDDVKTLDLVSMGPFFEKNPLFPEGVNTEFIHVINRKEIDFRVYERGSAETLACGTGACAAVVACVENGFCDNEVLVHLVGGDLVINYDKASGAVMMTGPAAYICEGQLL